MKTLCLTGCERRGQKEVKDTSLLSGLSNWVDEAFHRDNETQEKEQLQWWNG